MAKPDEIKKEGEEVIQPEATAEGTTTEKPLEEEAPKEAPKTKRQLLNDEYASMIEGYNPDDEEGSSDLILKHIAKSKAQRAKLSEALKSDPRLAQALADVVNGKRNAPGALARYFGKDFLNAEEGSPEYEEMIKAEEERKAEQKANEENGNAYKANIEKSMPIVEEFCKGKGYNTQDFLGKVWDEIVEPVLSGTYSKELCKKIDDGLNYDKDIKDAQDAGYIKGRNENIHKMEQKAGDGMPKIGGSEPIKEKPKKEGNSFLELATKA